MEKTTPQRPVSELRLVVTTDDHADAVRFYRDVLGLEELEAHEERGGHVTILAAGRATLEINDPAYAAWIDEVEGVEGPTGPVRVAFQVVDGPTSTDRLVEGGATLVAPPTRTPWNSLNSRLRGPGDLQLTLFTELDETVPAAPSRP